jgi:2-aminobenzoate-CoA ligase
LAFCSFFQARTDDMIVSAGYNISGPEVEEALLSHESVADCACVASPDAERGNVVKAFVVLKQGTPEASSIGSTTASLQEFVKAMIAPYKYPREIEFVESLPRTETGKVQRFKLREREKERKLPR